MLLIKIIAFSPRLRRTGNNWRERERGGIGFDFKKGKYIFYLVEHTFSPVETVDA